MVTAAPLVRRELLARFSWLTARDLPMVIPPNLDGLLTAAFMQHHLGWKVAAFYNNHTYWPAVDHAGQSTRLVWLNGNPLTAGQLSLGVQPAAPSVRPDDKVCNLMRYDDNYLYKLAWLS